MQAQKKPEPEFGRGSGKLDPVDVQLGARVRKLRIMAGISQDQVAQKIGLTFQQIQKYERGTNRISVATLLRLCDALGVSAAVVIAELAGQSETAEAPPKPRKSLSASRALLNVQSEPVRAAVIALLKAVAHRGG